MLNAKNAAAAESKKKKLRKNKGDSDSDEDEEEELTESEETTSDSTYEPPKHKIRTRSNSNLVDEEEDIEDTEDEDEEDEDEEDEEDEEDDDDDEEEETNISRAAIQKIISEIFPSKYMSNRAKQSEKEDNVQRTKNKNTKKPIKNTREKKGRRKVQEESDDDDEDDEDYEDDEDEDEDDGMYNILLLDGMDGQQPAEDDYNEEDDDAECDSDDEKMFMREAYEAVDVPAVIADKKAKKAKKNKKKNADETAGKAKPTDEDEVELTDVQQEYLDMIDTKKTLTAQLNKKPTNKILQKAVRDCDSSIKKLIKQSRINNAKAYHKLIHSHKKQTNEVDYFKKKLSNKEQLRVMNDLKEINSYTNINKPYRLALLDAKMPAKFKSVAMQKLSVLRSMDPSDNEYYKIKNWVDAFMKIPFGIYRGLSISIDDGIDKCHDYMSEAMTTLNSCVYGLNDAKLQIMQMVGQWISNPSALGTAIAIKGPMGTGKTTLVKDGISKILGRDFAFIALGGTGDSSFLEGHSYTYEGSTWGKIVQILINSKCMNPVIYFDELDKISDTPRGDK